MSGLRHLPGFESGTSASTESILRPRGCFEPTPGLSKFELALPDELRWFLIGKIAEKHWSAVITRRGEDIRPISVRSSRSEDVAIYEREDFDRQFASPIKSSIMVNSTPPPDLTQLFWA
jgi:hypothetical protein